MSKEFSEDVAKVIKEWVDKYPKERDQELVDTLTRGIDDRLYIVNIKGMVNCTRDIKEQGKY